MSSVRAAYVPYPFAAIVGQEEAKLALLLSTINPRVGGVLLSGPKGTGKTSIVRATGELLPELDFAGCPYGCDPTGARLCDECAARREAGEAIPYSRRRGEIVELPVSAQLDDVVGAIDLRAALERSSVAFRPGLLARANRSVLYVDEVNLLGDVVVDALLDAAAQGVARVKRGQHAFDFPARFTLIGTMNPEEGELRPQITDRIGLRVFVGSASAAGERLEIYRRNAAFARDPQRFVDTYADRTASLRRRLASAIDRLERVEVAPEAEAFAIDAVARLGIDSHRTEFVALEAAAALAAFEERDVASMTDVARVFPLAARLRRSRLKVEALSEHLAEDAAIAAALDAASQDASADRDPSDDAPTDDRAPEIVVSHDLTQKARIGARPQSAREGSRVATASLAAGGRLDITATIVDRQTARTTGETPDPKESVDAATPPRLTVLIVDASLSTKKSSELVRAAARELLRPVYTDREVAALIACWGPSAQTVVDEKTGRNVDLVASRLSELETETARALTPLPDALERARKIGERFRRANPGATVDCAIFSDGRANVPLGGEGALASAIDAESIRAIAELAVEQCRAIATSLAGRMSLTCVNLDEFESHPLMREIATLARGRYFPLASVVAKIV